MVGEGNMVVPYVKESSKIEVVGVDITDIVFIVLK